jgi:hypothetical protein
LTPQVFALDVCTAVNTKSPAKANGWFDRSTERYTPYPGTDVFIIRDKVAPE